MKVAVIGAGPTGLFLGATLARRGHQVTAIDRDAGPKEDQGWSRRGVMQFHHAHAFRAQCGSVLKERLPEAYDAWLAQGAEPIEVGPPGGKRLMGLRSRRETFERALRTTAAAETGLTIRRGHVDTATTSENRVTGVSVDGERLPADLVVDASGRSGRATRTLRAAPTVGGACGLAYVDRQYQLLPGAEPGPMTNPIAWQADFDGYQVVLFLHERGTFSVVILRPTADPDLRDLRHRSVFDAACRAIPGLSTWVDPDRARALTDVLPGGELVNYYRGQRGQDGSPIVPGLIFVGDSVCTTTPNFGRGVALSLLQADRFLTLLDASDDMCAVASEFDAWTEANMRPWVEDHVWMDESQRRRWHGEDIDLGRRLPSDLILAAAEQDPTIAPETGGYLTMLAGPSSLDGVEPLARAVYATGWRPAPAPGPTRDELAALIRSELRHP